MSLKRILYCALLAVIFCTTLFISSPKARAAYCTNSISSATLTYTAATLSQQQVISINDSWSCNSGSIFVPSYNAWVCFYMDSYTGQTSAINYNGSSYAISYSVYGTAGLDAVSPDPAPTSVAPGAGIWYGAGGGSTVGSNPSIAGPLLSLIRITIPAGAAQSIPPGTYTFTLRFTVDMQGGLIFYGTPCTKAGQGGPDGDGQDWGTATYTFTIIVPKSCSINSVDTLNFGNIAAATPLPTDVTAQGNIYSTCSLSTPYTLYLDDGLHRDASGSGNRNMLGSDGSSRLPYQLYTTSAATTIWDSVNGVSGAGAASQVSNTVYGKIPAGSALPGTLGTYRDSVVVTISY